MTSVEQMVSRQVALYNAARRREAEYQPPGRGRLGEASYGPYLLISRVRGCGSHTTACAVGERLGWQVFDGEIVDQIAERAQVRRQLIESLDEHTRSLATEILAPALNRHDIGQIGYLHHLRQVILALGHQGHIVIVGRGARYILPAQFGLRVLLTAPPETRAQRVAAQEGVSLEGARAIVQAADRERENFIHRHFQGRMDDPLTQDLIINTEHLTPAAVADLVMAGLRSKLGVVPHV